ncbi:MAG: hypothetical protein JRN21_09420 [Nitrososphaerota archaeon]|nr:hypothetical protein [Nitrososphaerota archaeon]
MMKENQYQDVEVKGLANTVAEQDTEAKSIPLTTSCVACKRYDRGYKDCVSYSWLFGGKSRNKDFVDRFVFHKSVIETPAMKAGTEAHKTLAASRRVISDLNKVIASIVSMRRTAWSAGLICTTSRGFRGSPDTVVSQLTETNDGYLLEHYIIEDKTYPKSDFSYLPQVWGEAETLTDPNFLFHVSTETLADRLEGPSVVFYELLGRLLQLAETGKTLHVKVYTVLNFYGNKDGEPKDNYAWLVNGEPKPADGSIRSPELWSEDFRVLDHEKSLIPLRQKNSRIKAMKDVTYNSAARQLRFTTRPRVGINVVETFPTEGNGVMGLYSPKTDDDKQEEKKRMRAIKYVMADLANFAKVTDAERKLNATQGPELIAAAKIGQQHVAAGNN